MSYTDLRAVRAKLLLLDNGALAAAELTAQQIATLQATDVTNANAASAAQSSANTAQGSANGAQSTANSASSAATAAQTTADSATSALTTAQGTLTSHGSAITTLQQSLSSMAASALQLAIAAPPAVALDNAQGAGSKAARDDHTHAARSLAENVTLDANGEATWTFSRSFAVRPGVAALYTEGADNQPINIKIKSWTITNGVYTGIVIKGLRARTLPASIINLLALVNYNLFGGPAPAAIEVTLIARERTG